MSIIPLNISIITSEMNLKELNDFIYFKPSFTSNISANIYKFFNVSGCNK